MRNLRTTALIAVLFAFGYGHVPAANKPAHPRPSEESLVQLVEEHFARWDRNHDNALELSEVDRVIEDHWVHGRLAALVVSLRRHIMRKGYMHPLPYQEVLRLAEERDFIKTVEHAASHLQAISRKLFLPTDPDLATFRQGKLKDCYLLATVAAQVHRDPKVIREMIRPEVTGGLKVVFGDGRKIEVPPLTDSELLLGAELDSRHGIWLAVLEKAYGIIRQHERAKSRHSRARWVDAVPEETLNFGYASDIISLLTGRQADTFWLGKSHPRDVHNLLIDLMVNKRLTCVGTSRDKAPPGIVTRHYYAILGYDVHLRQVKIFNPWGNHFTPRGTPGMDHGYVTKNGLFTVPLDQFEKVFFAVVYETDRPLGR